MGDIYRLHAPSRNYAGTAPVSIYIGHQIKTLDYIKGDFINATYPGRP